MENNSAAVLQLQRGTAAAPQGWNDGISAFRLLSYRFMVMDRLGSDLQKVCERSGGRMKKPTALLLGQSLVSRDGGRRVFAARCRCPGRQLTLSALLFQLDVLEYIHENEYVHADIKAANLMLGYRDAGRVSPGSPLLISDVWEEIFFLRLNQGYQTHFH